MKYTNPNETLIPGENCCPYCLAAKTEPPREYYAPRVYFDCNSYRYKEEFTRTVTCYERECSSLRDRISSLDTLHDKEMRDILGIIQRTLIYAVEEGAPYPAIINRVIACIPEEYRNA